MKLGNCTIEVDGEVIGKVRDATIPDNAVRGFYFESKYDEVFCEKILRCVELYKEYYDGKREMIKTFTPEEANNGDIKKYIEQNPEYNFYFREKNE